MDSGMPVISTTYDCYDFINNVQLKKGVLL